MVHILSCLYFFIVVALFVFIGAKHVYVFQRQFEPHMVRHHADRWEAMKSGFVWKFYHTKAIYDFVWKSDEAFNDEDIVAYRKKLRRIALEIPLFFVLVPAITFPLLCFGVLR